jgi:hypothetical protein
VDVPRPGGTRIGGQIGGQVVSTKHVGPHCAARLLKQKKKAKQMGNDNDTLLRWARWLSDYPAKIGEIRGREIFGAFATIYQDGIIRLTAVPNVDMATALRGDYDMRCDATCSEVATWIATGTHPAEHRWRYADESDAAPEVN